MAPATQKRKRGDRTYSADGQENSRPSPHRPQNLGLAQQNDTGRGRGGRRTPRGGNRNANAAARASQSPVTAQRPALAVEKQPAPRAVDPASTSDKPANLPVKTPFVDPVMSFYQYLTGNCISLWKTSGRQDIKDKALKYAKDKDLISLSAIIQEIVRSICSRRLAGESAGSLVKDILAEVEEPENAINITRHFLDCLSSLVEGQPLSDGDKMQLRRLLLDAAIDPSFMREQFEHQLLEGLGFVKSSFHQMATRYSTGVLYKQTTYNLLREDTEGYAKLISEYYLAAERGPPAAELVTEAFEKVKSLIGAFNLDPGRTLDVTLDVFGDLLVKRHRFFVRFLRASSFWPQKKPIEGFPYSSCGFSSLPWWAELNYPGYAITDDDKQRLERLKEERDIGFWDRVREVGSQAFFELGNRRAISPEALDESPDPNSDIEWIRVTKTFPPEGNRMAAQLLGFKLQYYASDIREDAQFPENLIWLSALLIHIGFISFRDLYPHLHPSDDGMEDFKKKLTKEKEDREMRKRPGGGVNALMLAGALVDDTMPMPRRLELEVRPSPKPDSGENPKAEEDEPALPEAENQKILLLKSLLLVGAIPEALFILGRFPWLIDLCPDLTKYIHRILNHCISAVYESLRPLADRDSIRQERPIVVEQTGLPKGHLGVRMPEVRRIKKWGKLDSFDPTKDADFKFYWEDWSDNVPVCRTVDDVFALCSSLLNISGVRIGEDLELLSKLARIGRHSIDTDNSQANQNRWIDLCKRILVPALSFSENNPALVNEVWDLLKSFSTPVRYAIYSEWYFGSTSRLPEMRSTFDLVKAETKDIMKRIHKQNTRAMARALAKVVHSCPGIVFSVALSQIEAYNNLIDVVVECARYFTSLGYDVLTWSILTSLGAGDRNRMQADGMLTSPWLKALSVFAGSVFKRYSNMAPSPILRYVSSQLYNGNSEDLEILEQIITSMAGIRSDTNYGEEQLRAMAGGPLLREQTLKQVLDKRHESVQSSKRLMRSLTESDLAGQILILIAQERQIYVYRQQSDDAPLKVLGNNLDKIHHAFVQYLDMLRSNVSDETFREVIPSIHRLIKDFGLDPSIAFTIWRDSIGKEIEQAEMSKGDDKEEKPVIEKANGDAKMAESSEQANGDKNGTKEAKDVEMTDAQSIGEEGPKADTFWSPAFQSLMNSLRDSLPPNFEEAMSLSFYGRFWQLSLYDFVVPKYENETKRLKDRLAVVSADRQDVSLQGVKKRDAEKKWLIDLQEALGKEMKAQLTWYQGIRRLMQKEKDRWFADIPLSRNTELSENIIQECFFPRILLSPMEAILCSKLIFYIHQIGTPGFRTIHIFDKMLRKQFLRNALFQCTAREAENFGRFLNEVFQDLAEWHREKSVFETKAWGPKKDLPGFCQKVNPDYTPHTRLEYTAFKALYTNWHKRLHDALIECLASDEYMHIRNAIIMLKAIHQQFPKMANHGTSIYDAVSSVSNEDPRGDLKLSALSLLSDLKKRKPYWIYGPAAASASTKSANSTTASRPYQKAPLDPKAPEFRSTTVPSRSKIPSSGDVEDGEINDAIKAARKLESKTGPSTGGSPAKSSEAKSPNEAPNAPSDSRPPEGKQTEVNGSVQTGDGSAALDRVQIQGRPAPVRHDNRRPGAQLAPPPAQHQLPSRPEGGIPSEPIHHPHIASDRPRDRPPYGPGPDYHQSRDRPLEQRDNFRARPHDASGPRSRNRTPEPMPPRTGRDLIREAPRTDRDPYDGQNRPVRDTRTGARGRDWAEGPRDRGPDPGPPDRARAVSGKGPSDQQSAPPREAATDRGPWPQPPGPDRLDRQERPVSEREPNRRYDDDRQDRAARTTRSTRHPSPRRDDAASGSQPRTESRSAGTYAEERPLEFPPNRGRDDPYPPSGPRSDRPPRQDAPDSGRRDLFALSNQRGGYDYTPPVRQQQDPNYGRLNAVSDAPSGPRSRQSSNRGRSAANGPSGRDFQGGSQVPPSPSTDRPPPFPSQQDWRDRRGAMDNQRMPGPEPVPSPSEPAVIHPSRANNFQNQSQADVASPQAPQSNQPSSSFPPPSGPRIPGRGPSGNFNRAPSPTIRNAPAPPPNTGDRRDTRHIANVNSHLQQAANSTPIERTAERAPPSAGRGRGRNSSSFGPSPSSTAAAPQQTAPSSMQQRDSGASAPHARQDLLPPRNMASGDRAARPPSGYPEQEYQDSRSDGGGRLPRHRERDGIRAPPMRPPPSAEGAGAGAGGEGEAPTPRRSTRNFSRDGPNASSSSAAAAAPSERDFGSASQEGRHRSEGGPPRGGLQQAPPQGAAGARDDAGSGHHGRRRGQQDEWEGRGAGSTQGLRNGERETRQRGARGDENRRDSRDGRKRTRQSGDEAGDKRARRDG